MPPSSTMRKRPKRERTRTTTRTCLRKEARKVLERKVGCESESFSADSVSAVDDVEDSGVSAREGEGEEAGALAMGRRTTAKEKPIRTTRRAESRTHHRRCVLL